MCGIVGYIGKGDACKFILDGLKKLEYRGYDSAGIAAFCNGRINVMKAKGRLNNLVEKYNQNPILSNIGIGHTRWATHGAPSDANAHPHISRNATFAVVHNGIIENYMEIKERLIEANYEFATETDTETVAHLLDYYYSQEKSFEDAVIRLTHKLRGAYALGIMCAEHPDKIIAVRKGCPLIVGLGEGENFIASDIPAVLQSTRKVYLLEENEIAIITKDSVLITDCDKNPIKKEVFTVDWDIETAEKGGYAHFMIKEIHEQPKIINDVISKRIPKNENNVLLNDLRLDRESLRGIDRIYIVACGSAYYAGLIGKNLIERFAKIPVEAEVASEFRYKNPILDERTMLIVVSQSGETADTLEALRIAKRNKTRVLAVVNAVGSTIAREADDVFYILAGPEIAVASTKAFSAQAVSMGLIACHLAKVLGKMSDEEFNEIKNNFYKLPENIQKILDNKEYIHNLAKKYCGSKNIFYIGRGLDYVISNESALKLKEVAYKHSESYPAGELKHGPIAMMEKETLVIAFATQKELLEKTMNNIKEVKARDAQVLIVTQEGNEGLSSSADDMIYIPACDAITAPIAANVAAQLFAYYVALELNRDIDKPRNLAKSVTVE